MPKQPATKSNPIIAESLEGLPRYLKRREVADVLRCNVDHVTRLVQAGQLLAVQRRVRKGVPMRIPLASVQQYLEATAR